MSGLPESGHGWATRQGGEGIRRPDEGRPRLYEDSGPNVEGLCASLIGCRSTQLIGRKNIGTPLPLGPTYSSVGREILQNALLASRA